MLYQYDTKWDELVQKSFLDDPFWAAQSWSYKEQLKDVTTQWLLQVANWQTFITFTFKNEISEENANRQIKYFIRVANELRFGNSYTRRVGHSYFQYVIGLERQERGVIHYHMLVDRSIDFAWIHSFWGMHHGHCWIETIDSIAKSLAYCVKYAAKEGNLLIYLK